MPLLNPQYIPHAERFRLRTRLAGFIEAQQVAQRFLGGIALKRPSVWAGQTGIGPIDEPLRDSVEPVIKIKSQLDHRPGLVAVIL